MRQALLTMFHIRHFTSKANLQLIKESLKLKPMDRYRVFGVEAKKFKPSAPRDIEKCLGIKKGRGYGWVEFSM